MDNTIRSSPSWVAKPAQGPEIYDQLMGLVAMGQVREISGWGGMVQPVGLMGLGCIVDSLGASERAGEGLVVHSTRTR